MEKGKDIFGMAFRDYVEGDRWAIIKVHTDVSDTEDLAVAYFFRSYDQMPLLEQKALDICKGKILDVGAGAGSHSLYLQNKGLEVLSLDISQGAVDVMKSRGVSDAVCQDYFCLKGDKFDTLLFLMNGAGIAGDLPGLEELLNQAAKLLKPEGIILIESTDLMYMFKEEDGSFYLPLNQHYYGEVVYQLEYRGVLGDPFKWLFVDFSNLKAIAAENGLSAELIFQGDNNNYLCGLKHI